MTNVVVIGDPHFKTDNITEVNLFIQRVVNLVTELQPTFCVVLGDVLDTHERLHTIPLNKAYEFITKLKEIVPTYVLIGNHDMISNSQFLNNNHWMNGMKEWHNVTIADKVIAHYDNYNQLFVFCPYVPPGRFEEALQTCTEDWRKATCIFAHQEIAGCKMGAIVSAEGDKWPVEHPYLISGHIHGKQQLNENVYYCGSAMQHAFGESEKNIIALVTFTNNTHTVKEIDLGLPRKRIIYTDVDHIDELEVKHTQDKIKITVAGNYEEFKAFKKTKKYKDLIQAGKKVVFKPKKINKEEKEEKTFQEIVEGTNFKTILHQLITTEQNSYLYQAYETIINN